MTKKDYVKIGEIFQRYYKRTNLMNNSLLTGQIDALVEDFCLMFKGDNERFDGKRFREFCKNPK